MTFFFSVEIYLRISKEALGYSISSKSNKLTANTDHGGKFCLNLTIYFESFSRGDFSLSGSSEDI